MWGKLTLLSMGNIWTQRNFLLAAKSQKDQSWKAWAWVYIYMSQVSNWGYKRCITIHAWQGIGNRSGMPVDVQASWHDSTAHVQSFFPHKVQKQMKVTSFDDITDVTLMYIGSRYKSKQASTRLRGVKFSHSFFQCFHLACSPVRSSGKPQTL